MNTNEGTIAISITGADVAALSQSDPLVEEKLKNVALIRMLGEANAKIAELEARLATAMEGKPASANGDSKVRVPAANA